MSRLRGESWDRCTLPWAGAALGEAARQVAQPQLLWAAGFLYQFLSFGFTFGLIVSLPLVNSLGADVQGGPFRHLASDSLLGVVATGRPKLVLLVPLLLVAGRLAAGLARVVQQRRWMEHVSEHGRLRLGDAWRAGRGHTGTALYLWVQVLLMVVVATIAIIVPAQVLLHLIGVDDWGPTSALVSGTTMLLTLAYGFLLAVVFQLALQSLVNNRRGVGSALLHAWRLVRNDMPATLRVTAMDAVLLVTAVAAQSVLTLVERSSAMFPALAAVILLLGLEGLTGCIRCAYWSRVYRALGGMETDPVAVGAPPAGAAAKNEGRPAGDGPR